MARSPNRVAQTHAILAHTLKDRGDPFDHDLRKALIIEVFAAHDSVFEKCVLRVVAVGSEAENIDT